MNEGKALLALLHFKLPNRNILYLLLHSKMLLVGRTKPDSL